MGNNPRNDAITAEFLRKSDLRNGDAVLMPKAEISVSKG
jgi:hypothetical protein